MEAGDYHGDPGNYDKKHENVAAVNECIKLCRLDANCCHWVFVGDAKLVIETIITLLT